MINKVEWLLWNNWNWLRRKVNWLFKRMHTGLSLPPNYGNRKQLQLDEAQKRIREIINAGEPALIARYGSNEALCVAESIGINLHAKKRFSKKILWQVYNNAGVFPYGREMALRMGQIMLNSSKNVDLLGVWDSPMQDFLVKNFCASTMEITSLGNLEPYYSDEPWTAALKGKKVLVIHPFKESIESQYKKREYLFENSNILPEFNLKVMRAVQTIAGEEDPRFADWEDALVYMYEQAMKIDFDVAIIGCGAYGMPLAAKLKESGKIAIHLGGATQLLFGIKGARWDNHPLAMLYNDYWVRPLETETPKAARHIEGACYW